MPERPQPAVQNSVTNANRKRQLAIETAAKEGLRASVPLYIAAAEAFAQEDRAAQGVELLGELLRAKEKRRGLLGRVEKNPLGPERLRVATKYAELTRTASPTEDTLEMLEDIANEFPDSAVIRRAAADGLRNAGYASDAIEEYRYCWKLEPHEGDIPVRLSELYAALGRTDEALEHLRKGIKLHAEAHEYEQVADRAMRFIDLNPDDLDDVFVSFELLSGEVLRKHVPSLDHLGVLVRRDPSRPAAWRSAAEQRLVDLYARVLEIDNRNAAARRGINVLGQQYLPALEERLRGTPAKRPETPPAVEAVSAAAVTDSAPQVAVSETPAETVKPQQPVQAAESQVPDLIEKSPGELISEDATEDAIVEAPSDAAGDGVVAASAASPDGVAAEPPEKEIVAASPAAEEKVVEQPAPSPAQSAPTPAAPAQATQATPPTSQTQATPAAPANAPAPAAAGSASASAPSKALYAFALRKAQEQFDAGSYEESAQACDRMLKRGDIPEVLTLLARCYIKLDRKSDAVRVSLRLADTLAAHDPAKALETLSELIKTLPDAALILRRSQLLTTIRQVEFAGKKN